MFFLQVNGQKAAFYKVKLFPVSQAMVYRTAFSSKTLSLRLSVLCRPKLTAGNITQNSRGAEGKIHSFLYLFTYDCQSKSPHISPVHTVKSNPDSVFLPLLPCTVPRWCNSVLLHGWPPAATAKAALYLPC